MTDTAPVEDTAPSREIPEQVKPFLRTTPSQPRSVKKFFAIWDAAVVHYHDVGPLRFRTSVVSENTNCSIGMIYRYFKDKAALLEAVEALEADAPTPEKVAVPEVSSPLFLSADTSNLQSAVDEIKTLAQRLVEHGSADNAKIGNAFLSILEKKGL